jgi:plastocyanin
MRATSRLAAAALALPLVLTACAQKERVTPTDHATPRAVPSVPATVFPRPSSLAPTTEAPTGAPSGSASSAPAGGGNAVKATGANKFEPGTLTVKVGTKVTWTAEGFHSVDSGTPDTGPDPAGPLKAPMGFTTYSYTFTKAGTYKYFCQPHAQLGMTGEVVVS